MRSAVRLPMPGDGREARDVAGRERGHQVAGAAAAEDGERHLRPDGLDADEQQEEVALLLRREAVELEGVVADDEVAVEERRVPEGGDLAQRLGRHGEGVAHAAGGLEHDAAGAADGDLAGDGRDHAGTGSAAASGAWLAWQMATARASAAWSGRGASGSDSSAWTMRPTWSLAARPVPHTAPLTCWGV